MTIAKTSKLNRLRLTKQSVIYCLGGLWLIDGLLQLQPQMFSSNFITKVIGPASSGQPVVIAWAMHFFSHIFLAQPVLFNSLAAITQLVIAFLILNKKTVRLGLLMSVSWGLFVWAIGEGFGGIFSTQGMLLVGLPGAALIYVILALAVLPTKKGDKLKLDDQEPPYWLAFIWLIVWLGGAIYTLLPSQNSVSSLSTMIASGASSQPGWLAAIDLHLANHISQLGRTAAMTPGIHMTASQMAMMPTQSGSGGWFILVLALIEAVIGLSIFLPKLVRQLVIGIGIVLVSAYWVIGQNFGGLFTGVGTDPNSGPLIILLAICILSCSNLRQDLNQWFSRLERRLT